MLEELVLVLDQSQGEEDRLIAKVVKILDKMHLSNR